MFIGLKFNISSFPGLWGLLERDYFPTADGIEQELFKEASGFRKFDGDRFSTALAEILQDPSVEWVVVSRNTKAIFDKNFLARLILLGERVKSFRERIAIISGGGLEEGGGRCCALYSSAEPFILYNPMVTLIIDTMIDLYIVSATEARRLLNLAESIDSAFELAVISTGYAEQGKVSIYAPELAIGINGPMRSRNLQVMAEEFAQYVKPFTTDESLPTLAGPMRFTKRKIEVDTLGRPLPPRLRTMRQVIDDAIKPLIDAPKISVVTRTQFRRPFLLRRLLTSVSRARVDHVPVEVVLSTDIDADVAAGFLAELQVEFPKIALLLTVNDSTVNHSRIANLIGGIEAAQGEYIWILDDDDYVDMFCFEKIGRLFFAKSRPIVTGDSAIHEEVWDQSSNKFPVLSRSMPKGNYLGCKWRSMFNGVNQLPICATIMPREFVLGRIKDFSFEFDLSEDYTLFLMLLTAPDLPPIVDLNQTIAHISIRPNDDNSVTAVDRTQWTRDIAGNLYNVLYGEAAVRFGCWAGVIERKLDLMSADARDHIENLQNEIDRKNRQISELLRRVKYLQDIKVD